MTESEKMMHDLEPIYPHPTEYDESDDLEEVKASIEKRKKEEEFINQILSDKQLAKNLNILAENFWREHGEGKE